MVVGNHLYACAKKLVFAHHKHTTKKATHPHIAVLVIKDAVCPVGVKPSVAAHDAIATELPRGIVIAVYTAVTGYPQSVFAVVVYGSYAVMRERIARIVHRVPHRAGNIPVISYYPVGTAKPQQSM